MAKGYSLSKVSNSIHLRARLQLEKSSDFQYEWNGGNTYVTENRLLCPTDVELPNTGRKRMKFWERYWPPIVFVLVITTFYVEEDVRGKWAWSRFKREWEAKGETFDRGKFIPPPVPDDQNFALTPIVFTSYGKVMTRDGRTVPPEKRDIHFVDRLDLTTDLMDQDAPTNGFGNWSTARLYDLKVWQDFYRKLAAKTNFFPVAPQPQTPAKDVLLALSRYDSTLEELDKASRLRYSRFPLDYSMENPAKIYPLYCSQLKSCSVVLQLRAIAELQDGQSEKALKDVQLTFRLAESIHAEPLLPSQLMRSVMIQIALQTVYEGLARHEWSDSQLAEIESDLAKVDFLADFKFSMRSELVFHQQGNFDFLRRHPEESLDPYRAEPHPFLIKATSRLIPSGWFYQNQTRCARWVLEDCIPAADLNKKTVSPSQANTANAILDTARDHLNPYNFLESSFLSQLESSALRFAKNQSSIDLARVAIALERFRLAHSGYPQALSDLTPQFLQNLPHDIINGQPLKYRRTDDGQFVLYSVGWDEKDDGGLVVINQWGTSQNIKKGDWVWRYPVD
jgi:hypothetical protein